MIKVSLNLLVRDVIGATGDEWTEEFEKEKIWNSCENF